ncbi:MAG: iron response transcriptional regulator IrrA [Pseudomonadales bacterium]
MNRNQPDSDLTTQLKLVGLRPTRQRLELLQLLCGNGDRHVTPENLHLEARDNGIRVSLATVYNTLNLFTDKGVLRRLITECGVTWFDTNISDHHHFYNEVSGELTDFPAEVNMLPQLPEPPKGRSITGLNIVVSIR